MRSTASRSAVTFLGYANRSPLFSERLAQLLTLLGERLFGVRKLTLAAMTAAVTSGVMSATYYRSSHRAMRL
jgi:hypothetical protein